MGIPDIYHPFTYRGLDMGITVQSFEVDDERNVDIEDYEISLDPSHSCENGLLIRSMLNDGRSLQEKIFDTLSQKTMDDISNACLEEWDAYLADIMADRELDVCDQFIF